MKKIFLCILLSLMWCNIGFATPMWKISEDWICIPSLHTKMILDGTVLGVNEIAITKTIDFKNSKITSSAGNQIGKIIDKLFVHSPSYYVENILIIDWKGYGKQISYIKHDLKTDQFWNVASSGMPRGTIYSSFSKCSPL